MLSVSKAVANALEESTPLQIVVSAEGMTEAIAAAGAQPTPVAAASSGDRPVEGETVISPTVT